ncbi:MAG TPA: PEP-CTERM sorting domain-containing protein [Terriglobia bacterium]|nr:PEP-CTERM sorting domain-containing protein [Terriglobia bacterium]
MSARTSRLSLLAAAVVTLLITGAAFAGSIKFNFGGTSSQASWGGVGSDMTVQSSQVRVATPGDPFTLQNATISFTSGPGTGGAGTTASPFTFGASATGSITITGCLQGQGSGCTPVTLFTGQFLGGEQAFWSNGEDHFKGMDVSGTLNPALASFLGFQSDMFTGELGVNIVCRSMASGTCMPGSALMLAGGSLLLQDPSAPAVPEPSTLVLLASGLAALSFGVRLRSTGKN